MAELHRIRIDSLKPGLALPADLLNADETIALARDTVLTESYLSALLSGAAYFLGNDDWPVGFREPQGTNLSSSSSSDIPPPLETDASPARTINVETLNVGMRLSMDIFDPEGVLLLSAGAQINSRFIYLLRKRGIRFVHLRGRNPEPRPETQGQAESDRPPPRGLGLDDLYNEARSGIEQHVKAGDVLREMSGTVTSGGTVTVDKMDALVNGFVDQITVDQDLLMTLMSLKQTTGEYLFDHSINVALMSMTIGSELGLPRHQLQELGLGAVFQDVGMLRIPDTIRMKPGPLSDREWELIRMHPAHTLKYLEGMRNMPTAAAHVAYQAHERADGSGYPRGRHITTTHPFARVVGVSDTFCAMTRPRPHRPAFLPHRAVQEILHQARANKFDRNIVRVLLDRISAFPVGSIVQLSDGREVRVVRAKPGKHTLPVVAEIDEDDNPIGETIDLSAQSELRIERELRFIHGSADASEN